MAAAPKWKFYLEGQYLAACKNIDDALALCDKHGEGSQIKLAHGATVWTEGKEKFGGIEYDLAIDVIYERLNAQRIEGGKP